MVFVGTIWKYFSSYKGDISYTLAYILAWVKDGWENVPAGTKERPIPREAVIWVHVPPATKPLVVPKGESINGMTPFGEYTDERLE